MTAKQKPQLKGFAELARELIANVPNVYEVERMYERSSPSTRILAIKETAHQTAGTLLAVDRTLQMGIRRDRKRIPLAAATRRSAATRLV